jgi:RNA polymerase sigma factor (sigma-70 family)
MLQWTRTQRLRVLGILFVCAELGFAAYCSQLASSAPRRYSAAVPFLASNRPLLDGFRAGDPKALTEIYRHYAPPLARFLRSRLRHEHDVENALQEVFVRAFKDEARRVYDPERPYAAYLQAIGRNYLIDEARRGKASPVILDAVDAEDPSTPDLEQQELQMLIKKFVAETDERTRAYYQARYEEELTQAGAAEKLGITRIQARRVEAHFHQDLVAFLKKSGYLAADAKAKSSLLSLLLW